jgi:hypothetical protein
MGKVPACHGHDPVRIFSFVQEIRGAGSSGTTFPTSTRCAAPGKSTRLSKRCIQYNIVSLVGPFQQRPSSEPPRRQLATRRPRRTSVRASDATLLEPSTSGPDASSGSRVQGYVRASRCSRDRAAGRGRHRHGPRRTHAAASTWHPSTPAIIDTRARNSQPALSLVLVVQWPRTLIAATDTTVRVEVRPGQDRLPSARTSRGRPPAGPATPVGCQKSCTCPDLAFLPLR